MSKEMDKLRTEIRDLTIRYVDEQHKLLRDDLREQFKMLSDQNQKLIDRIKQLESYNNIKPLDINMFMLDSHMAVYIKDEDGATHHLATIDENRITYHRCKDNLINMGIDISELSFNEEGRLTTPIEELIRRSYSKQKGKD